MGLRYSMASWSRHIPNQEAESDEHDAVQLAPSEIPAKEWFYPVVV